MDGDSGVGARGGDRSIKTLSNMEKSTKSQKVDFAKAKLFGADFLTSRAKKAFIYLQNTFTKALILHYVDTERHICIETDISGYAIDGVLSQITSDQHFSDNVTHKDSNSSQFEICQWHPTAFFTHKMISAKTHYKTHYQELLAIVEAFKT